MHLVKITPLIALICLSLSCKKKPVETPEPIHTFSNGLLVVNEGLYQQNNSTLSWINLHDLTVNNEVFEQKTGRQLGDTGNDIVRYGSKIYITVTTSSTIEVLDANTGASIQQINMIEDGTPKQPRFMETYGGKLFITCFDGFVDVMDTSSFEIVSRIPVGKNPEEIRRIENRLYVANSGGISFPQMDSTLSVIDPVSQLEIQRITVGKNPIAVQSDNQGNIYVGTKKTLGSVEAQMVKLNAQTLAIDSVYNLNVNRISKMNDKLILYVSYGNQSSVQLFNTLTGTIENNNFINTNAFTTFYGAHYDATRNQLYCFDALSYVNAGYIRIYSPQGQPISSIKVGLNPSKLLIYE